MGIKKSRWTIEISNKGNVNTDPNDYKKIDIWVKVYEYYEFYYNKYAKKI